MMSGGGHERNGMEADQNARSPSAAARARPPGRPPFRADHVGSLLRPPELLRAREHFAAGRLGAGELREAENAAIRDVVRMQQEAGLRAATDGELRRESWHLDFIYQLGGIKKLQGRHDLGGQRHHAAAAVGQAQAHRRNRTGGLGHVVILAAVPPGPARSGRDGP